VLRYSNLFDHVVGIDDFDFEEEPDEEEACEDQATVEARAQEIIRDSGNWQDELQEEDRWARQQRRRAIRASKSALLSRCCNRLQLW
jgi:hypothetical protein